MKNSKKTQNIIVIIGVTMISLQIRCAALVAAANKVAMTMMTAVTMVMTVMMEVTETMAMVAQASVWISLLKVLSTNTVITAKPILRNLIGVVINRKLLISTS